MKLCFEIPGPEGVQLNSHLHVSSGVKGVRDEEQ